MTQTPLFEHPEDVLCQWLAWDAAEGAALAVVSSTHGGGVRATGALMAVSATGQSAGYVSGGCIDADVALHAVNSLSADKARMLTYGTGSPFKDLPLPCGGTIEILILPSPDRNAIQTCHDTLVARRPANLVLQGPIGEIEFSYTPKLRVRIAGRGADAIALARLCRSAGYPTELWMRDAVEAAPHEPTRTLSTPSNLPDAHDDAWTAFVLLFHDPDWEVPLLRQALSGPAFYIGAVGSKRTHSTRCEALSKAGAAPTQIDRVRGPVGLVPAMRDASMLAVSTLAEIVEAYHTAETSAFATTALVMLAAGQSSRFEDGDKLLADLGGQPVIAHAAKALSDTLMGGRIAVIGPDQPARRHELNLAGWRTLETPHARRGQGASLAEAIRSICDAPGLDAALILLADMPHVTDQHLLAMRAELKPGIQAVLSRSDGIVGPPALFSSDVFEKLATLDGEAGARSILDSLANTKVVDFDKHQARDIDRKADLEALADPSLP
ncbi:MAG: NTP transferase domain-containing protein [Pseudomonadota bacterium]